MKKTLLYSFCIPCLVLICLSSCSKQSSITLTNNDAYSYIITMNDAQQELEEILAQINEQTTKAGEKTSPRKIVSKFSFGSPLPMNTKGDDEIKPYVHVFNFEDDNGFAIMSGDNRVESLLALSQNGEITPDTVIDNPGLTIFLEHLEPYYTQQITNAEIRPDNPYSGPHEEYGVWQMRYYPAGGTCPVTWNQQSPYNDLCPLINGQRALTGCVATAVAQLMSIYKFPPSYNEYPFDWDTMVLDSIPKSIAAKSNIAGLMQQLGLSHNLDMNYGLDGSSASPNNIPRTLENFGYSNGGTLNAYSTTTVVNELQASHGVLLGGFSDYSDVNFLGITIIRTYSGGHRWLAHGLLERYRTIRYYDENNVLIRTQTQNIWYPLCNWGWGGNGDGYYLSNVFNKPQGPAYTKGDYNYQYDITAITGIRQ